MKSPDCWLKRAWGAKIKHIWMASTVPRQRMRTVFRFCEHTTMQDFLWFRNYVTGSMTPFLSHRDALVLTGIMASRSAGIPCGLMYILTCELPPWGLYVQALHCQSCG